MTPIKITRLNHGLLHSLLALALLPGLASAGNLGDQHDLLLFPVVHLEINPNSGHETEETEHHDEDTNLRYGADIVYTWNGSGKNFIAEAFLGEDEFDIEQLKYGQTLGGGTSFWLGRYHIPSGFWNSQYHHGVHLQTAVHRPAIVEYEDAGGVLPNHITGLEVDHSEALDNATYDIAFSLGLAAKLTDEGLESFRGDNADEYGHNLAIRLTRRTDNFDLSQQGVFANYSLLKSDVNGLEEIDQYVAGAYLHHVWTGANLTASAFYVDNSMHFVSGTTNTRFVAGYVHGEYEINHEWLVYGRSEQTIGAEHDTYLTYFESFGSQRNLLGLRFDFTPKQAISVEHVISSSAHGSSGHSSVQWSAVFP